jgi:alkanesulfonate monooxygenase SsuD/methylene tetrahydromethanopterin reductase-like flavin-dependent oxidoreductase (luciferase family)
MKIGIGIPNQIRDVDPAIVPEWASRAEKAGFCSLASLGRTAYPGVMDTVALAGAAAVTSSIELTSTVMLATVWPPVLFAKELASIDAMSGGRLTLGLGIGGNRPDDFVVEGLPAHGLGKRIDADLEVYRSVWAGEPVGGGVNPAVPAGTRAIPLMFGGMVPAAFERMAKWGQGYIGGSFPAEAIKPFFEAARQAWTAQGREGSPKLVAVAYYVFGDADEGRKNIWDYYSATGADMADQVVAGAVHVGSDGVRRAIDAFAAIGADELIFNPAYPDLDEIDMLADSVL